MHGVSCTNSLMLYRMCRLIATGICLGLLKFSTFQAIYHTRPLFVVFSNLNHKPRFFHQDLDIRVNV